MHAVHCEEQIEWLAAHHAQAPHSVFLKLNSGMNRLGFAPQAYRSAYARLAALPLAERQAYWAAELSRCLKCYACRAACLLGDYPRARQLWELLAQQGDGEALAQLVQLAQREAGALTEFSGFSGPRCPR